MTLKQNTDFKKRFDEYIEKHSRKTEKNKIKTWAVSANWFFVKLDNFTYLALTINVFQ